MITVDLTFAYENTDFTRLYSLEGADSLNSADIKAHILQINDSLKNGTAGGLSTFFVSDTGDNFVSISSAKKTITTEEYLDLSFLKEV